MRHEAAVVGIELHHIGHRAQRHEIEQGVEPRLIRGREDASLAQLAAQREKHIEHHADTGEVLALEAARGLVGVHDDVRVGQRHHIVHERRQVVVGDEHVHALGAGVCHAGEACDAVVHREQHVGPFRECEVDDGRRESIAVHRAIGHDVAERTGRRAQERQSAQRDGAGRGAVAVVVGDHADALSGRDGVRQQSCGVVRAEQIGGNEQLAAAVVEFVRCAHASRGEQPRQQGMHASLFERPGHARRNVAQGDGGRTHRDSRTV